jgi:signal transduction histidine kinase
MRTGLTPRIVVACALLALLNAVAFAVLLSAIRDEHNQSRIARRMRSAFAASEEAERAVGRMHIAALGAAATADVSLADDWSRARGEYERNRRLARRDVVGRRPTRALGFAVAAADRFVAEYSAPLLESGSSARGVSVDAVADGQARLDATRARFATFRADAQKIIELRQDRSDTATRRGIVAAAVGLTGSVLLMAGFAIYLLRAVLRPLRRASRTAGALAAGDLSVRMPERGVGEIGELERSFNHMASELEVARDDLVATADEQAALHRVAALVAAGPAPETVFEAVVEEIDRRFAAQATVLLRYETDGGATVLAARNPPKGIEPGARITLAVAPGTQLVTTTGAGEGDHEGDRPQRLAGRVRELGFASAVSAPIVVDARPWGAVIVAWDAEHSALEGTGTRVEEFTKLVATAIANAEDRAQLASSRARVVTAGDQARRRIERDLHDGAQQRLVSLALELRLAQAKVPDDAVEARAEIGALADDVATVVTELQELSRGIHPAVLTQGGLAPALRALARRAALPVEVSVDEPRRVAEPVEIAAYYIVSEAVTNTTKHAEASVVEVDVRFGESALLLEVRDDGRGGADLGKGSGLLGLQDRVDALGGSIQVVSRPGSGTRLTVRLPYGALTEVVGT